MQSPAKGGLHGSATMLAQSAWRCMSTMLRHWCCPSMRTQADAPTVRAVIQPAAAHLTCVGRSRKRS